MGMTFEFLAGDREAIVESIQGFFAGDDGDGPDWHDLAFAKADFSIHVTTTDLGILTDVLLERTDSACDDDTQPDIFEDSIADLLFSDDEDYGVQEMSPEWVAAVATVPDAKINAVAATWFASALTGPDEKTRTPTPEAVEAIGDLLKVCRTAVKKSVPVLLYWSL